MQKLPGHLDHEADIGSGEKSPGQRETEKLIEEVGDRAKQPSKPPATHTNPERKPPASTPR